MSAIGGIAKKLTLAGALIFAGALPVMAETPDFGGPDSGRDPGQDKIISQTTLETSFSYVDSALLTDEQQFTHPASSISIRFKSPQTVLSSLFGWGKGILAVGNHYNHFASWPLTYDLSLAKTNARTMLLLGLNPRTSSFLYTGAEMKNHAYVELEEENKGRILKVGVFATAGVKSNAMRAGFDSGDFWEPGTINLIILTNRALTPAAMTRIMITATEAKTAALEDLDIRSSYTGLAATGTGTDNIIVAEGSGSPAALAGGHAKLGDLIAKAVYRAVTEAIGKQNGIVKNRNIAARLEERKINLETLLKKSDMVRTSGQKLLLAQNFEALLQDSYYAGFLASALAVSDAEARGLTSGPEAFRDWCLLISGRIAGSPVKACEDIVRSQEIQPALRLALNALLTGLARREGIVLEHSQNEEILTSGSLNKVQTHEKQAKSAF